MPEKKPYFPNNWRAIKDAPSEYFEDIPFDQFMDWKMAGWEIPSSISCIIREHNLKTGKVKEYIYERTHAAENKLKKIMSEEVSEITVVNHETIHHLTPKELLEDDYDDPLA